MLDIKDVTIDELMDAEGILRNLIHLDDLDDSRNVFSAQESFDRIPEADCTLLNIKIPTVDGEPTLLYADELYDDVKEVLAKENIPIEMPVDRILKMKDNIIVLIGVRGSGKTRSCYDLCRHVWALYFDCTRDDDFEGLVGDLEDCMPEPNEKLTVQIQETFEHTSRHLVECLIAARLLVLKALIKQKPDYSSYEWKCTQRSRKTRELFKTLFKLLSTPSRSISGNFYDILTNWFKQKKGRIIFDECHRLLDLLPRKYRSSNVGKKGINLASNSLEHPRSLFSFLTGFVMNADIKSLWCGTHMRIKKMEFIYSAAGASSRGLISFFTEFVYLEPRYISFLLQKWLNIDLKQKENADLVYTISTVLQGRPRFLSAFLIKLLKNPDMSTAFDMYMNSMTTRKGSESGSFSPYCFWADRFNWLIEPLQIVDGNVPDVKLVSQVLLKLLVSSLFGDGGETVSYSGDFDVACISLLMVKGRHGYWQTYMIEPITLTAGLNWMRDHNRDSLMNYFASQLFAPLAPCNLSSSARGQMMELVIALRFMQEFWKDEAFQKYLPAWFQPLHVPIPSDIIGDRRDNSNNMFLQHLTRPEFPWIVLPKNNDGPDLVFSVFHCASKTTWTASSHTSMFVEETDCVANMNSLQNIYASDSKHQEECRASMHGRQYIQMRFELPDTSPDLKKTTPEVFADGNNHVIRVNLGSQLARDFFGNVFVNKYQGYVEKMKQSFQKGPGHQYIH